MVTGSYLLGGVCIEITAPESLPHPVNLKLFKLRGKAQPDFSYTINELGELEEKAGELLESRIGDVFVREDLRVFYTQEGECRLLNFRGDLQCYAISSQTSEKSCSIWFSSNAKKRLELDTAFWAPFCLERLMIGRGGIVLHSAYMEREKRAILFSAPSGTGKSTQAALWEKYRKTRTINGDRTLIMKKEGSWMACGWPICGSSEICKNEEYPLEAIVMLGQSRANSIRRIKGIEAVRSVLPQLMINGWSRSFEETGLELIEDLLSNVPIYRLECDISEQAVECLESSLLHEGPGRQR